MVENYPTTSFDEEVSEQGDQDHFERPQVPPISEEPGLPPPPPVDDEESPRPKPKRKRIKGKKRRQKAKLIGKINGFLNDDLLSKYLYDFDDDIYSMNVKELMQYLDEMLHHLSIAKGENSGDYVAYSALGGLEQYITYGLGRDVTGLSKKCMESRPFRENVRELYHRLRSTDYEPAEHKLAQAVAMNIFKASQENKESTIKQAQSIECKMMSDPPKEISDLASDLLNDGHTERDTSQPDHGSS